jgi:hypothetical protein
MPLHEWVVPVNCRAAELVTAEASYQRTVSREILGQLKVPAAHYQMTKCKHTLEQHLQLHALLVIACINWYGR